MSRIPVLALGCILLCGLPTVPQAQDASGRIEGRVTVPDGRGHGGIAVVIVETGQATLTDGRGLYRFLRVPAGTYTLTFKHRDDTLTRPDVVVTAGETTTLDVVTEWALTFAETMTVYAASRKQERIVEAPAAVTVVSEREIQEKAASGQLPKLLEFTPGAEVTQSGLYDYNFNTRGFNSSLNRRVATLIDGRDPSVPFLGAQEWSAISFPLDDIATIEFLRGPSAALYGANASSGLLNVTTKQPRYSPGGLVRFTGGELSSLHTDFRFAGPVGRGWFWKVAAGTRDTGDFTVSRNFNLMSGMGRAEYSVPCSFPAVPGQTDCLPQELVPLQREDDNEIRFGSLRFDKYWGSGEVLTLEAGMSDVTGPVFQTGIGRVQLVDVQRPWARANFSLEHWNVLLTYNRRDADEQLALASGSNLALDAENAKLEVQTNWDLADAVRVVAGASREEESIDSRDPQTGLQTLIFEPIEADFTAVFAQLDWEISDAVKLVLAGRWDDSSLHDSEFSPKGSVVWKISDDHTLRLTYNEAFQVANYSEFFLQANAAAPANTQPLENICLGSGVTDCGLAGTTRVLALGNRDLKLEQVRMAEIGYSGILADKAYLTVDYYESQNEDFITDLLPNLGTALGRVNPNFGAWVGSMAAETTPVNPAFMFPPGTTVAQAVRLSAPLLSNNVDGSNIIAAASYTNFGEVDTRGVDVGLNYYLDKRWTVAFAYSWFDFDIKQAAAGLTNLLLPNSPENKASAGVNYQHGKLDGGLSLRWSDEFRWVVGPFQGDVESYTTVDLVGNYRFDDHWAVGINVSNLLDDEHWESFGGDVLGRRALANASYRW